MDFYWLSVRNEWLSKPDGLAFTCRNNQDIRQKLDASRDTMDSYTSVVDESEASTVLSSYTTDIIKHTLDNLGNLKEKTDLVNKIVNVLAEYAEDDAERYHDNPSLNLTYNFTIRPYSYQQEVLDQLEAERELRGYYGNLVVARLLGTVQ